MLDEQVRHIAEVIQHAEQRQAQVIEPTAEAEAEWVQTIRDTPNAGDEVLHGMHARLLQRRRAARKVTAVCSARLYGAGPVAFFDLVRDWRCSGGMKGLQFG